MEVLNLCKDTEKALKKGTIRTKGLKIESHGDLKSIQELFTAKCHHGNLKLKQAFKNKTVAKIWGTSLEKNWSRTIIQ